jgi:hypothetical protein
MCRYQIRGKKKITGAHRVLDRAPPDQCVGIAGPAMAGNAHDGGRMVAPTGVNEGSPPESIDPVPTQAVPLQTGPAETALAKPGPAETELTGAGPGWAEPAAAGLGPDPAAVKLADAAPAEAEPAEAEPVEVWPTRDISPLAIAAIVFGVIALVGVAAGVLAVVTHGFHKKAVVTVTYRPAAVFKLRPGDCINSGPNGLAVTVLSCGTPHDAEVFATFSLPTSSWPGVATAQQEAGNGCASRLSGYLNPDLANAGLAQEFVYPNQTAWQAGERTVVCEVSSPTGKLTGSVRQPS